MGTSGAYGGSSGWSGIGDQTQEWLDGGAGVGIGGPASDVGDGESSDAAPISDAPAQIAPDDRPPLSLPLATLIGRLGRRLSSSHGGHGRDRAGAGSQGGKAENAATRSGGRGRSVSRASSIGGRAAAGVYGLRSGNAGTLDELGLSLDELRGLPKHQQARRLVDAALGPSGGVAESELRLANAELILWALNEESEPAPIDVANRWVVEYVWQVWISEAGPTIRNHVAKGYDSKRVEDEMRAALEATVAAGGLPDDRPLSTRDFERAIESALGSLERIGRANS